MAQQFKHFWQYHVKFIQVVLTVFFLPYFFQISQSLDFKHPLFYSSFPVVKYLRYQTSVGRSDGASGWDCLTWQTWFASRRGHVPHHPRLHRNSPNNFLGTSSSITFLCHKEMHKERVQRLENKEWKSTHHAVHVYSISPSVSTHIHFQHMWSALKEQQNKHKGLQSMCG